MKNSNWDILPNLYDKILFKILFKMFIIYELKSVEKVCQKYSIHRKERKISVQINYELCNDRFYEKVILLFSLFSIIMMECSESSSHERLCLVAAWGALMHSERHHASRSPGFHLAQPKHDSRSLYLEAISWWSKTNRKDGHHHLFFELFFCMKAFMFNLQRSFALTIDLHAYSKTKMCPMPNSGV